MSTPAQSKIEFASHLIKISSQIFAYMGVKIGFIKGVKNLTPKTFHTTVSHQIILANFLRIWV